MSYEPTIWENGKTPINADNLNKIENELSLLSTNTEALQGEVDEVKADIEALNSKVDVDITEGSTKTLSNSFNGGLRFKEIEAVENEQTTTTGKNLIDIETNVNSYKLPIPLEAGTYTISFKTEGSSGGVRLSNSTDTSSNSIAKTGNKNSDGYVVLTITTNYESNYINVSSDGKATEYMLVKGAEKLPYEPYTGGIPAPNPNYPQDIKSVSISGMKTVGKNLFNSNAQSKITNGVTFIANTDGSVTANGTATADIYVNLALKHELGANNYIISGCPLGGSKNTYQVYLKNSVGTTLANEYGSGATFSISNDDTVDVTIKINNGVKVSNLVFKPMIRYADVEDTTFVPYQESSVTLSNFKLNGIGNVKDRLIRKDGVWQIERKIKSYTFTGNESGWNLSTSRIGSVWIDFYNKLGLPRAVAGANSFSSHFATVSTLNDYTKYGQALVETAGFNMWMKDGSVSGESEVKEFLANKNVTFSYVMETPTHEVLPLADQVALNSLLTFDGITYLDIESVLEPQFELEYGTSKVGGYTLQSLNTAEANEVRIKAMETLTANLAEAIV